ncbi:hypothetical protein ACWEOZ_23260 [Actinoplanes sp. NPDC004185]
MDNAKELPFLVDVPTDPAPRTEPLTEDEIIGAVADLLADRGYRFIPDARLPEMKQALRPFLLSA